MNILHIIGNGFDLNQGLPTSYAHFYEYYLQVVPTENEPRSVSNFRILLQKKLYENRTDKWADLEIALGELSAEYDSIDEYLTIYLDVYRHLMAYLNKANQYSEVEPYEHPITTIYDDLCTPWRYLTLSDQKKISNLLPIKENINVSIINFNYTDTFNRVSDLASKEGQMLRKYDLYTAFYRGCRHLHHRLATNDILLGVDNLEQIANTKFRGDGRMQNYLIKPLTNSALGTMVDDECRILISNAHLICIYGTSIGDTDKSWWKEIGNRISLASSVCVVYFPFVKKLSDELPLRYPLIRNTQKNHLLKMMEKSGKEIEERVFVNFCNIPSQTNIFTNPKRKNLSDNFENVMAHFQNDGVIVNPTSVSPLFSVTLEPPVGKDPLFIPRVYKERK